MKLQRLILAIFHIISLLLVPLASSLAQGTEGGIFAIEWNVDGSQYALGYWNGIVEIRDANDNQLVTSISFAPDYSWTDNTPFQIQSLAWSPDGTKLAVAGTAELYAGLTRIFDTQTGALLNSYIADNSSNAVSWNPDGTMLANAIALGSGSSAQNRVEVRNVLTGQLLADLELICYDGWLTDLAWSPDGASLASVDLCSGATIWNTATWSAVATFSDPDSMFAVEWSPSGAVIATGGSNGSIQIWDPATGQLLNELSSGYDQPIYELSWHPAGSLLASAGGRAIQIWDANTGALVDVIDASAEYFTLVAWSPDGTRLLYSGQTNPAVLIPTPPSGGPDQILFSSADIFSGESEIYLVNPDGTGMSPLTNTPGFDSFPAWSSDGSRIAFASTRDGDWEIYVMDSGGSNVVQLTTNAAADEFPAWSPDGTQIAFSSNRDGNWELYVMDADGSNPVRLTDHSADDLYASWSPDGTRIAFSSARDGNYEIYVINADGGNLTRLTDHPNRDETPSWSPDGTQIAFTTDRDGGNLEIYAMNGDGTNVRRLTTDGGVDEFPNWSPDGSEIVFSSARSSTFGLYLDLHIMHADGTNVRRLTTFSRHDRFASWGHP